MIKCFAPFKERTFYTVIRGEERVAYCCKIKGLTVSKFNSNKFLKELNSTEKNTPSLCSYCWRAEELGQISWRQLEGKVPDKWKNVDLLTHPRGKLVQTIKIATDSVCDSACVYCDANNSTVWDAEVVRHENVVDEFLPKFKYGNYYIKKDFHTDDKKIKRVKLYLTYVGSEIYKYEDHFNLNFLGGEPFLSPHLRDGKFIEFIDCFFKKAPHDFPLIYEFNTNANTPKKIFEKNLSVLYNIKHKYKNSTPKVVISGESTGNAFNYIRYGSNYDLFVKNVESYMAIDKWLQVSFGLAINAFCIPTLSDYFKFIFGLAKKYDRPIGITAGTVYKPHSMHPSVLPNTKYFRDCIDNAINEIDKSFIVEHNNVDNLIHLLHSIKKNLGQEKKLIPELKGYVKYFNITRNVKIEDHIPELAFLNE